MNGTHQTFGQLCECDCFRSTVGFGMVFGPTVIQSLASRVCITAGMDARSIIAHVGRHLLCFYSHPGFSYRNGHFLLSGVEKDMKKLLLLILVMSLLTINQAVAYEKPLPKDFHLIEVDLFIDGSITPQLVNISGLPVGAWITVLVINFHFEDNALNFSGWGAGNNLTNGTAFLVDGVSVLERNLTTNHGFGHISGDLTIFTDDRNPKDNHFVSRLLMTEIVPPWGIQWESNTTMQFLVQDNQTAAANALDFFSINIEGFSLRERHGLGEDGSPDVPFVEFLDNQLRVIIGIAPWLLLIAFAIGILYYAKKQIK